MTIYQFHHHTPKISPSAFIADSAQIIGKVNIAENSSIWFNTVIRGDNEEITIEQDCNIQEASVLHTDMGYPLMIGKKVTVGHQAMLHGCQIKEGCLIGIQAIILNGAIIGKNCLVGAGALITENKVFPDNSLILGSPAKIVRTLSPEEINQIYTSAQHYVKRGQEFKTACKKV